MTELLNSLEGSSVTDFRVALASILMAFALAHLVAAAYSWTHRGLSYSRSFVHTLVMGGVVAAMLMLAIGNNLVWGIGIVGTLAIIRFRTNLRDPRDMVFIFAALAAGIAAGVRAYAVGLIGTVIFCGVSVYLNSVPFGARNQFDGLLRFTLPGASDATQRIHRILQTHCSAFVLASLQQVALGDETEHAYQVRFRRDESRHELVRDLEEVRELTNLSLLMQETQVDV
ncbi:MAG: DUF4956 domain-containing protein [Bryobacteraceae bacterium]|nr:DUF4956 domain-containing protein [Bryobacteraceae bacterium]